MSKGIPKAEIVKRSKFSKIWILPIITIIIGGGIIIDKIANQGMKIELIVKSAEGIEAAKTKVKLKAVDIGIVKSIHFNNDASRVVLRLEIEKEMSKFINKDTKFWIVKPRVTSSEVSGLGTILSGSYISILPGDSKRKYFRFNALDSPPIDFTSQNGTRFTLFSTEKKALNVGSKIYYKGFEAGSIEAIDYDRKDDTVLYQAFIKDPYDEMLSSSTHFWNISGISIQPSQSGFKLNFKSIDSIFGGAIEFGNLKNRKPSTSKPLASKVRLYSSKEDMLNHSVEDYIEVLAFFSTSISGLKSGASVEFKGMRVGTVGETISLEDMISLREKGNVKEEGSIAISLRIEPSRFVLTSEKLAIERVEQYFKTQIENGMQATIKPTNILTGTTKVSLDYSKSKVSKVKIIDGKIVIPTGGIKFFKLANSVGEILNNLSKAKIKETVDDLREVLAGLKPNSGVYKNMEKTMDNIQTLLEEVRPVLKRMENEPNSFIFGDSSDPDKIPQAKE